MRYRKRSIKYTPKFRKYSNKIFSILFRKQLFLYHPKLFKISNIKNNKIFSIMLSVLLILIGTFSLMKNTIVYTPIILGNVSDSGASFAPSSILILLGIIIIFMNKKSILGYLFLIIGFSITTLSIFLSLKMRFLPTPLFKTLCIFGSIVVGVSLLIKTGIKFFKR